MTELIIRSQENKGTEIVQDHQDEIVSFCGTSFPKSAIKNHADFTIENKLGEGTFGSVYQGHLDIGISR